MCVISPNNLLINTLTASSAQETKYSVDFHAISQTRSVYLLDRILYYSNPEDICVGRVCEGLSKEIQVRYLYQWDDNQVQVESQPWL